MGKATLRESAFHIDLGPLDEYTYTNMPNHNKDMPANGVVAYGAKIERAIQENSAHWGRRVHEGPEWVDL